MKKLDNKHIVTRFDYEMLTPEQRMLVQQRTGEIRERLQRSAQDVWEIGQRLAEVRNQIKHGHFDSWLKAEFGWSRRTAYNFINVYESFRERANLAQIDIATSALYLLAAPSTPQDVREQYLLKAKEGEKITHKDLREKIEQEKLKATTVSASTSEAVVLKPDIVKIIPRSAIEVEVSSITNQESAPLTPVVTETVQAGWYLLARQHLVFCGDTASPDFYQKIPETTFALAATSSNWEHDWLIDVAKTLIVLPESSLDNSTLEKLIAMFSQRGETIVLPWLPNPDMIAIAHKLGRKVVAGDTSPKRCHKAIMASGLNAVPVEL